MFILKEKFFFREVHIKGVDPMYSRYKNLPEWQQNIFTILMIIIIAGPLVTQCLNKSSTENANAFYSVENLSDTDTLLLDMDGHTIGNISISVNSSITYLSLHAKEHTVYDSYSNTEQYVPEVIIDKMKLESGKSENENYYHAQISENKILVLLAVRREEYNNFPKNKTLYNPDIYLIKIMDKDDFSFITETHDENIQNYVISNTHKDNFASFFIIENEKYKGLTRFD